MLMLQRLSNFLFYLSLASEGSTVIHNLYRGVHELGSLLGGFDKKDCIVFADIHKGTSILEPPCNLKALNLHLDSFFY